MAPHARDRWSPEAVRASRRVDNVPADGTFRVHRGAAIRRFVLYQQLAGRNRRATIGAVPEGVTRVVGVRAHGGCRREPWRVTLEGSSLDTSFGLLELKPQPSTVKVYHSNTAFLPGDFPIRTTRVGRLSTRWFRDCSIRKERPQACANGRPEQLLADGRVAQPNPAAHRRAEGRANPPLHFTWKPIAGSILSCNARHENEGSTGGNSLPRSYLITRSGTARPRRSVSQHHHG